MTACLTDRAKRAHPDLVANTTLFARLCVGGDCQNGVARAERCLPIVDTDSDRLSTVPARGILHAQSGKRPETGNLERRHSKGSLAVGVSDWGSGVPQVLC